MALIAAARWEFVCYTFVVNISSSTRTVAKWLWLPCLAGIAIVVFFVARTSADNSVPQFWVTDSLAKVQPNATPGTGKSVDISAARNEFESFQVHVRAAANAIQLSVKVSDFVNPDTAQTIAADPNVAVFREGYLNVTTVSDLNGISGRVPDALIPVRDQYFREPRNAFPVTIPAEETRSAWIDVFVPPSTGPGYYLATITVSDGSNVLFTIPARLRVWGFTLPSVSTLKSSYGMSFLSFSVLAYGDLAGTAKYPGSGGSADLGFSLIHADMATFFLDHRVSISAVVPAPMYPMGNWTQFDAVYGPLLSGTAKTTLKGARLTTFLYPNAYMGPHADDLKDWLTHSQAKGWFPRLFQYQCDEPPAGCTWANLMAGAKATRAVAPTLPLLVTTSISKATDNSVLDLVDILSPVLEYMQPKNSPSLRSSYDAWLALPGKQLWWYQSCDEHESCVNGTPGTKASTWPSYMVDASPVRNRIFQWMAYLYKIQGELYYDTENWGDNPWDHLYFAGGNGDGALYYPGTVDKIGGKTPVPVASIRLKLIREGMEDYEYLAALAAAGHADLADQAARSFITNAYTFRDDPAALYAAREKMGTYLSRLAAGLPLE